MFKYLILVLALNGAALPAQAEEPQEIGTLTRLEEKLRQHPEITAYASRVEASGSYAKGEMGLPDPMLFIEQEDYRFRSDMGRGGGDKMIGFRQEIPRYSLREARADRLRVESHKNRLLQDYAFAAMKAKMIASFANLQKVKELRAIALEQEKLLKTQRQSLKGSVAANRAGLSTVPMTDAEIQEIDIMLSELEEERHGIEAMLINMLGEAPDVTLPPVEIAAWNRDPAKTYPVIIAASDIDMAKKDVDIREAEYGPNFEIRASGGRMNDGADGGSIMLGLSIPLWASENQKPKLQGAKASLSAAEFDRDAVKRQIIEKLDHLKAQIDTSVRKIELFEKKESLLKAAANAASREYEAGKADFAMILKTRREAFSVRAQAATERAKHTALVADFNRYIIGESQ
jgi:outer membrane protein TolC